MGNRAIAAVRRPGQPQKRLTRTFQRQDGAGRSRGSGDPPRKDGTPHIILVHRTAVRLPNGIGLALLGLVDPRLSMRVEVCR